MEGPFLTDEEVKIEIARHKIVEQRAMGETNMQEAFINESMEGMMSLLMASAPMLYEGIKMWGWQFHFDMLQEECAEAIVAVSHMKRGRTRHEPVMEESVDAVICAISIALYDKNAFMRLFKAKMERLQQRINHSARDKR